ncbi:disease resistance protein RGA2-like [Lolium rigidum]|uniref:disease resistance protein RGA2-like n=1 Tax=Lolium rigidum TaxID=89674 RepID=UPI001F5E216C|nr:disease resistance protein RGA2-like [Lolium rigidum]
MEALISAVLGDIVSRAISVVVEKCREQTTANEETTIEDNLQRLHQLLLRISAAVEEAEGRCITNQGMIRQVSMMIKQMFRGYYLLDSFKCRNNKTDDEEVSLSSFAQSKFNPAKRFRRLSSNTQIESMEIGRDSSKELKQVVLVLESMVADMKEFAIFLMNYPRMYRQPYGSYLFLDNCMFGRQMEKEQAISFLLQAEPLVGGNLGVLPIVGPRLIGKSTLVEHVYDDERVRNHFSLILRYRGNDLTHETATTFRDHCVIKHQNIAFGKERLLVVIELLGDVVEGAWKRLLQTSERCMAHGSKIIITSRSEKMVSVGTTQAIMLRCLSKEAYWYFFKMLVFGSTDPEEHPKLTSIAMELALVMRGSFVHACVVAAVLRAANLSAGFWSSVLREVRKYTQNNTLVFGEYPEDHMTRFIWSIPERLRSSEDRGLFLIHHSHQKGPATHGEVPRITLVDLISGTWSTLPRGKFEVLRWRSLIPPYYTYVYSCELVQNKNTRTEP